MDFLKYKNESRPNKVDYTVVYFYSKGETLAKVNKNNERELKATRTKHPRAVEETLVDEEAYRKACGEHQARASAINEQFIQDMFEDVGVPDNVFTRQMYAIAYSRASHGYSEIYHEFSEMAVLWELAKKVFE